MFQYYFNSIYARLALNFAKYKYSKVPYINLANFICIFAVKSYYYFKFFRKV